MLSIAPAILLLMLVYGVLFASYEAACQRWMVRGERGGFFGLTLGADTWRVWFGYWIWFFLMIGFSMLTVVVTTMVGGGAVFAMTGQSDGNVGLAILFVILVCFALLGLWIWVAVRLAPGAATSARPRPGCSAGTRRRQSRPSRMCRSAHASGCARIAGM